MAYDAVLFIAKPLLVMISNEWLYRKLPVQSRIPSCRAAPRHEVKFATDVRTQNGRMESELVHRLRDNCGLANRRVALLPSVRVYKPIVSDVFTLQFSKKRKTGD